jgi:hypothetical protein
VLSRVFSGVVCHKVVFDLVKGCSRPACGIVLIGGRCVRHYGRGSCGILYKQRKSLRKAASIDSTKSLVFWVPSVRVRVHFPGVLRRPDGGRHSGDL